MHVEDAQLVTSPSDLVAHLSCPHRSWLEIVAARTGEPRPGMSAEARAVAARGDAHERDVLERLRAIHGEPVALSRPGPGLDALRAADAATAAVLAARPALVYQPTFFDADTATTGRADFLVGAPVGDRWEFTVVDAKLAATVTTDAVIQCAEYARHISRLTGDTPPALRVATPVGDRDIATGDVDGYLRRARRRFHDDLTELIDRADTLDGDVAAVGAADDLAGYPVPKPACARCSWAPTCDRRRHDESHVSLVAGIRPRDLRAASSAGVTTIEGAAAASGVLSERVVTQASAQAAAVPGEPPPVQLRDTVEGRGLASLPEPHPGDLFFDFEGDPLVAGGGLEYLAGVWVGSTDGRYEAWWAHDREQESDLLADLLAFFDRHLEAHPGAYIYHYAPYEQTGLRRLVDRHGHSGDILDRLDATGVFVDLYTVVRDGLVVGAESYSIKYLEPCYGFGRGDAEVQTSLGSVVAYENYLALSDPAEQDAALAEIADYNRDDVVSTLMLRDWLEQLRVGAGIERCEPADVDVIQIAERSARRAELATLADTLAGIGAPDADAFATLVSWHDRERSAAWRDYFERAAATDDERVERGDALAGLHPVDVDGDLVTFTYPAQDAKLRVGGPVSWIDPATDAAPGDVVRVQARSRRVTIRMAPGAPMPGSLIQGAPLNNAVPEQAMLALARARAAGVELGVVSKLLARTAPDGVAELTEDVEEVCRFASTLDGDVLAVQGPPGTGKTYLGSHLVAHLLRSGARVGICGPSHRAIDNLFDAVARTGVDALAVRRCARGDVDRYEAMGTGGFQVIAAAANPQMINALKGTNRKAKGRPAQLVAGTQFAFTSPKLLEEGFRFDYLVIDEAGQFPLAAAVAVAGVADNVVLLGDPAQLAQVEVAEHGDASAVSALGHVSGGSAVLAADRGVFLPVTRRMGADVCAAVSDLTYDGRLRSHPDVAGRHLVVAGRRVSGVHRVEVTHTTRRVVSSPEEVDATVELVDTLLGAGEFVDGPQRWPLSVDDIVVIAPFNAQVNELADALERRWPGLGARVGTVDRFQGTEAPVAIYSLGTSMPEESRGIDFVFSTSRCNVALSRAMAAAFIVADRDVTDAVATSIDDVASMSRFVDVYDRATTWTLERP